MFLDRGVQKTENLFLLGLRNLTVQKFNIRSNGFLTETACNTHFKLKVTQNNVTRIQCTDKERFITRPKQILAYNFYNAITLLSCCRCCE